MADRILFNPISNDVLLSKLVRIFQSTCIVSNSNVIGNKFLLFFAVQPHVNHHDCSNKPRIKQWDMQKVGGAINVAEEGGAQLLP